MDSGGMDLDGSAVGLGDLVASAVSGGVALLPSMPRPSRRASVFVPG